MNHKEYNGWHNYETWCVNLWLTNDQGTDEFWREQAQEMFQRATSKHSANFTPSEQDRFDLADSLKDSLEDEENCPALAQANVYCDLIRAALSEVNWAEIANAFLEDVESRDGAKYEYSKD